MNELTIKCPSCKNEIQLTEALAAPLLDAERRKAEAEVTRRVATERKAIAEKAALEATAALNAKPEASAVALAEKDAKLRAAEEAELAARKAQQDAEQAKREVDLTVQRRVDAERESIAKKAAADATATLNTRLKAADAVVAEKDAKLRDAQAAEIAARKAQQDAEQAKREIELTVTRQVEEAKATVAAAAAKKAVDEMTPKLREAEQALAEKDAKLKIAQQAEVDARRLRQEAEDAKREVELTVQRRLDDERGRVREAAVKEREDAHRLIVAEKDKQLADMREQIEEARRKGNAGSQQLAGDVQEMDLHDTLQAAFPADRFERVKKGQRGGDVLQTVVSQSGVECGRILWESKRTKAWSDSWLSKARDDQREANAELAVIATETMPDGVTSFSELDKVWVTSLGCVIPVAAVLRHAVLQTSAARRAGALSGTKKDLVYGYLISPQFRARITAMIDAYMESRAELEREKRATVRQWAARDKQLERISNGLSGMYGDLQGIVGASLPEIEQLSLPGTDEGEATPAPATGIAAKPEPVGEEI